MKPTDIRRVMGSGLLALAFSVTIAVAPVHAQTPATDTMLGTAPATTTGQPARQTTERYDDGDEGGMDWGWIGLLGLAGLLGLRRKDDTHVTRVDTTTGTGTTRPRT